MASESVTHMIFFIAAIVVASSMAAVFIGTSFKIADSIDQESDNISAQLETNIAIINDPVMMPYENGILTIYVENQGDDAIAPTSLTVILDGVYMNDTSVSLPGGGAIWGSSVILQIDIYETLAQGDHEIQITTPAGVSERLEFRI